MGVEDLYRGCRGDGVSSEMHCNSAVVAAAPLSFASAVADAPFKLAGVSGEVTE